MSKRNNKFSHKDGVTLKEYFEVKLEALRLSVDKSEQKLDLRLEGMNEIREQLRDQATTFVSKDYYDARHESLRSQIEDLRLTRSELSGKAKQSSVIMSTLFALIGIVIGVVSLLTNL